MSNLRIGQRVGRGASTDPDLCTPCSVLFQEKLELEK